MIIHAKITYITFILCSILVAFVFSAYVPVPELSNQTAVELSLEQKSQSQLPLVNAAKRPRQEDDDDDDGVIQRIASGFNRVVSGIYKNTVKTVFGTRNSEGDRENGLLAGVANSPWIDPLSNLLQSGVSRLAGLPTPKPIKTNSTKRVIPKTRTTTRAYEEVENEEEDNDNDEEDS